MKTILFDLDGTLIDSRKDLANAVNASLVAIGHKVRSEEEIVQHVGNGLANLLKKNVGSVSEEELKKAHQSFSDFYSEHCVDFTQLYPDVYQTIEELARDKKIGVVTNKPYGFADTILEKLKLKQFVKVLIGGDSTPEKKPDPEPLLEALRQLQVGSEDAIIFGDGVQDIEAGQRANIKTAAVSYGFGFNHHVLDYKPDFVINSFSKVKEIVQ